MKMIDWKPNVMSVQSRSKVVINVVAHYEGLRTLIKIVPRRENMSAHVRFRSDLNHYFDSLTSYFAVIT